MFKIPLVVMAPPHEPFDGFWTVSYTSEGKSVSLAVTRSQRKVYELIRDLYLNGFWGDPKSDTAIACAINAEFQFAMKGWQPQLG